MCCVALRWIYRIPLPVGICGLWACSVLAVFEVATKMVSCDKVGISDTTPLVFGLEHTLRGLIYQAAGGRGRFASISGPAGSFVNCLHPMCEEKYKQGIDMGAGGREEEMVKPRLQEDILPLPCFGCCTLVG